MANGSAKVIQGFPGAGQVPTVGQRMCPLMSKAVLQNGAPGTITVQCVQQQCRLWEWCSGKIIEGSLAAMAELAEQVLDASKKD